MLKHNFSRLSKKLSKKGEIKEKERKDEENEKERGEEERENKTSIYAQIVYHYQPSFSFQ